MTCVINTNDNQSGTLLTYTEVSCKSYVINLIWENKYHSTFPCLQSYRSWVKARVYILLP